MASIDKHDMDLQYGDCDCDFTLSDCDMRLYGGEFVYFDGTPFGGEICTVNTDVSKDGIDRVYKGRTFQGILSEAVIEPPMGSAHRVVSGNASDIIASLLSICKLDDLFHIDPCDIQIQNYRFYRYIDLYTGLRMMLSSADSRLSITVREGRPVLSAIGAQHYGRASSERVYFNMDEVKRPINGLIGLGPGVGTARIVSKWFSDIHGNISQTQSQFGSDARILTYQIPSEEASDVPMRTRAKLEELRNADEMSINELGEGASLDVGDRVSFFVADGGESRESEVVKVILKSKDGIFDIDYAFGRAEWPDDED